MKCHRHGLPERLAGGTTVAVNLFCHIQYIQNGFFGGAFVNVSIKVIHINKDGILLSVLNHYGIGILEYE